MNIDPANIARKEAVVIFDRFFDSGKLFWRGMGNIYDVFVLNSLWLLCCLPIFTIGPATTALFYSMINLVRGEEHSVSQDFFHSFKQNFKQGISLGLPLSILGVFLAVDIMLCRHAGTGIYTFFMVFFSILFLCWGCIMLYSFPLLAKFDKKNKEILIWAFTLSIRHFVQTAAMLLVLSAGLWICHILPGLIFIAFGLVAEFQASVLASLLRPYLPNIHEALSENPLSVDKVNENEGKNEEESR